MNIDKYLKSRHRISVIKRKNLNWQKITICELVVSGHTDDNPVGKKYHQNDVGKYLKIQINNVIIHIISYNHII